jgi:hypothetical protein
MQIYRETIAFIETGFREIESKCPSPEQVSLGGKKALRYKKKHHCIEIAMVLKMARYISGLNASLLLLKHGFFQELGSIFRTLDEFGEDMMFLALANTEELEEIHQQYLEQFFQEEFDTPNNAILSTQKRALLPRKKICGYIANDGKNGLNQSDSVELSRTLSQAYSGYVHGASIHILEMLCGTPPKYALSGMTGTYRQSEFEYNFWDYVYRGLMSITLLAKKFGDSELVDKCYKFIEYFEKITGDSGSGDPAKLMKEIKRKGA